MSPVETDAVVGRVVREHAETAREIAVLEAELDNLREMYDRLGRALGQNDLITFDEESFRGGLPYQSFVPSNYHFESSLINGEIVKTLSRDLRAKKNKRERLLKQIKSFGL